uniref:Uncharacterized protein n=1 Tax=Acrobeloides nanus TaxID=290746 RepID=A0A914E791_9BILA
MEFSIKISNLCDELEGDVATFYNVNLLLWGATTHSIFLGPYYPTVYGAIDTYRDSATALQTMMISLSWDMLSLIYTQEESCTYFVEELDASDYAPTLHDSIYLYAVALSNAINKSGNSDVVYNGTYVGANNDFQAVSGVNGNIKMGRDGFRKANYLISSYNDAGKLVSYLSFQLYQHVDNITGNTIDDVNATKLFTDPSTSIWANHGGVQPTSTPKCGFDGLGCPIDAFIEYRGVFIAVIIVGCAIAIGLMYGAYMIYR